VIAALEARLVARMPASAQAIAELREQGPLGIAT
jgi:hypothetical protein